MSDIVWIDQNVVQAIHSEQIAEHSGATGIRDEGLLDSALARPHNLAAYGEPKITDLAAAYAFGITRNHPFVDGNKRTAFVVMELFLASNGYDLRADDSDCVLTFLSLAAGELSEAELAAWIGAHVEPR